MTFIWFNNMIPVVHILITLPAPSAIKSSLLVFKTLRTGFPKNTVIVYGNNLGPEMAQLFEEASRRVGAVFRPLRFTTHGNWIEKLIDSGSGAFWICDGDVVFWKAMPTPERDATFAGRFEPKFLDPWSGAVHVQRLHPGLMWFNPTSLRASMSRWAGGHDFFSHVDYNLIRWNFVPQVGGLTLFYDTCAGLYHALLGAAFSDEQNSSFDHLLNGTYLDLAAGAYGDDKAVFHDAVFADERLAHGLKVIQDEWYRKHACV